MHSDQSLLASLLANEPGAESEFVSRYRRLTVGLAVRRFGFREAEGEEIFQELVLRLWNDDFKALRAWRGKGRLSSYLAVVVSRLCLERRREMQVARTREHPSSGRERALAEGYVAAEEDPRPSASESLLANERAKAVHDALQQLPAQQRLLLLLRYERECSPSAIGEMLGIRAGTARKRLHDARNKLRHLLLRRHREVFDPPGRRRRGATSAIPNPRDACTSEEEEDLE